MIQLDTSLLIDALTGTQRSAPALRRAVEQGAPLALSALVLYEWRRGPRTAPELAMQEALWPSKDALEFGPGDAATAAALYRTVSTPRGREMDLAIAACAIRRNASLWTLNVKDVRDVPGLDLYRPE